MIKVIPETKSFCSIDYESYSEVPVDGCDIPLYKIKNVTFNSNELNPLVGRLEFSKSRTLTFNEPVFLFDVFGYQYYHMLYDKVAQLELIRSLLPELKVVFISNINLPLSKIDDAHAGNKVILDILKLYEVYEKDIVYLPDYDKVSFSEVVHFTQYSSGMLRDLPGAKLPDIKQDILNNPDTNYVYSSTRLLSVLVDRSKLHRVDLPRKIYISRASSNSNLAGAKEVLLRHDSGKMLDGDRELLDRYISGNGGTLEILRINVETRSLDEENNTKVENLFSSLGYAIVHPHEMSFFEQVELFFNATHIAGFKGTGFSNVAFCKPETRVFIMNLNNQYRHFYPAIARSVVNHVFEFPTQDNNLDRFFSFDDIKLEIETNYLSWI